MRNSAATESAVSNAINKHPLLLSHLHGGVDVGDLIAAEEATFVVDDSVDDAVADGLGHDVLGGLGGAERQPLGDVGQGDARVADVEAPEPGLDYVVRQAADEDVGAVRREHG